MTVGATLVALLMVQEAKCALRAMNNNRAVRRGNIPVKLLVDLGLKEEPVLLTDLHGIIAPAWKRSEVSQKWKDTAIRILCEKND